MKMRSIKPGKTRWIATVGGAMAFLASGSLFAGDDPGKAAVEETAASDSAWSYLDLWDYTTLYSDKENPYIQEVKFIGRYHGQYHYVDSNRGTDDGWENRRLRPGLAVKFLSSFKFQAEVNIQDFKNLDGPFFTGWDNFYINWKVNKALSFRLGRQKSNVSQERFTSSKYILTFNRSLLVNQLTVDKTLGLSATYRFSDKLLLQTGIFSDLWDNKFDDFDDGGSVGALMRLAYGWNDHANTGLDYWYADGKKGSSEYKPYRHVLSLNSTNQWEGYGLNTDLFYGRGQGAREGQNVFGLMLMPWYDITEKLQGVFRYQLATSDSNTGIFLQKRYEAFAVDDGGGRQGDLYNAFYAGLNYRIHGDKLKLMVGSEYSNMSGRDEFSGWTQWLGVRTYW